LIQASARGHAARREWRWRRADAECLGAAWARVLFRRGARRTRDRARRATTQLQRRHRSRALRAGVARMQAASRGRAARRAARRRARAAACIGAAWRAHATRRRARAAALIGAAWRASAFARAARRARRRARRAVVRLQRRQRAFVNKVRRFEA